MLFPSQIFILIFLPLAVMVYYAAREQRALRLLALFVASMIFYAWWDLRFVPVLLGTMAVNWLAARAFAASGRAGIVTAGVVFNLLVLGFFKYTNFLAESALTLLGLPFEPWDIVLPLGVSFFTFQQIAYLVDLRRGETRAYGLLEYASYVTFFPHLIAGPILRHNELIPQFARTPLADGDFERIGRGLVLFILGLVKKVFLADELAPIADAGFALADPGSAIAWQAALAYSLQLYFDFSGYSDMALGLAGMFCLDLPINFDAPYRASSIREFWRRWHMTLSRLLRDYVYIPLGGSRQGVVRTYGAALLTMLLCGLWHGAGWTYVAWGGLHGVAVCCNRWWMGRGWRLPLPLAWLLTMLFVIAGWVLFRAADFGTALRLLTAMVGSVAGTPADIDDWTPIVIGAAFALLGPTNLELSRTAWIARRSVALTLALLMVAVVMRVGQGRGVEFIYFQF